MGVPFETIYPASMRRTIMSRVMNYLSACLTQPPDTLILSPVDGLITNTLPSFEGGASSNVLTVEVSIKRAADSIFYNGVDFSAGSEVWLTANGANPWNYALPIDLADGVYALRARALVSSTLIDATPSAVTFTLDTVAPLTPTLIAPTGGITIATFAPTFSWSSSGGDPARFEINLDEVTTTLNSPLTSTQLVVAAGDHHWRVRAFDAASNASAWSEVAQFQVNGQLLYLPIVTQNFSSNIYTTTPTCNNVILNGDFETGNWSPQWQALSQNPMPGVVILNRYNGNFSARVGVAPEATASAIGFSSIQQAITIPVNALTATLSFAHFSYSTDVLHDLQYAAVLNSSNAVLEYLVYERSNDQVWQTFGGDLLTYAGQSIRLRFSAYNANIGGTTGLLVDDVVVTVCTP
jgi:hypothetical protein